jgi:hypothetical protein
MSIKGRDVYSSGRSNEKQNASKNFGTISVVDSSFFACIYTTHVKSFGPDPSCEEVVPELSKSVVSPYTFDGDYTNWLPTFAFNYQF